MSMELDIIKSSPLSEQEIQEINRNIDDLLATYKNNHHEINQLVDASVSAMTDGEGYERELSNKKGIRRLIGGLTGSNKRLQDKINSSRAAAQHASQLMLNKIAEQNLLTADLVTAINQKLNSYMYRTDKEINQLYVVLIRFFNENKNLDTRVTQLEKFRKWNIAILVLCIALASTCLFLFLNPRQTAHSDNLDNNMTASVSSPNNGRDDTNINIANGVDDTVANSTDEPNQLYKDDDVSDADEKPNAVENTPVTKREESSNEALEINELGEFSSSLLPTQTDNTRETLDIENLAGTWIFKSCAAYFNIFERNGTYYIAFIISNGGLEHYLPEPAALFISGEHIVASYEKDNNGNYGTIEITFDADGKPYVTATMNNSSDPQFTSSDDLMYLICHDEPLYYDPNMLDYPIYKDYLDTKNFR